MSAQKKTWEAQASCRQMMRHLAKRAIEISQEQFKRHYELEQKSQWGHSSYEGSRGCEDIESALKEEFADLLKPDEEGESDD